MTIYVQGNFLVIEYDLEKIRLWVKQTLCWLKTGHCPWGRLVLVDGRVKLVFTCWRCGKTL